VVESMRVHSTMCGNIITAYPRGGGAVLSYLQRSFSQVSQSKYVLISKAETRILEPEHVKQGDFEEYYLLGYKSV
jgi:hypothetical protein